MTLINSQTIFRSGAFAPNFNYRRKEMNNAIGLIETKGFTASIEAADVMLKTADVALAGKEKLSGDFVTIIISGELEQVRKAVHFGAAAALRVGELIAAHVIVDPHKDLNAILPPLLNKADSLIITEDKIPEIKPTESLPPKTLVNTVNYELSHAGENKPVEKKEEVEAAKAKPTKIIRKEKFSVGEKVEFKKPQPRTATKQEKVKINSQKETEVIATDQTEEIETKETEIIDTTQIAEPAVEKRKKQNKSKVKGNSNLSLFDNVYGNDTISRLRRQALGLEILSDDSEEEVNRLTNFEEKPERKKVNKKVRLEKSESVEALSTLNVHQLRRAARDVKEFPIKGRQISKANRDTLLDYFRELHIE